MSSNKDGLMFVIIIISTVAVATLTYGTIGGRWYSCRSQTHPNQFDVVFSLWEVCERTPQGDLQCKNIEEEKKFDDVLLDFKLVRTVSILASMISGLVFILSLLNFAMRKRKGVSKYTIITYSVSAALSVVLAISGLIYASVRAQDIVGEGVKYVFGWSCVVVWVGMIISFLNAILSLVLMCMYFDEMHERGIIVARDMNIDTESITSTQLDRIVNEDIEVENINSNSSINHSSVQNIALNDNMAYIHERNINSDA